MSTFALVSHALLALWTLIIMWTDWRERRVPNALILLGALSAGAAWLVCGVGWLGSDGGASLVVGSATALFLLGCYAAGWVGGGDVKFLVLIPLLAGPRIALFAFVWGALLSGVWALAQWLRSWPSRVEARSNTIPLTVPYGAALLLGQGVAL